MKRSFHLTTLFNIPVEINYTWFIILGLVVYSLARGYFPYTDPDLDQFSHWLMAVISALLLFASLLAHEFSHSLVAMHNKLSIKGITLFVFGGVAHMENEPQSPGIEFKMAAAGPAMSFFLALVFFALSLACYNLGLPHFALSITQYLMILNIAVGLFNLIPGFPLDGGRILRAALWHYLRDIRKATAIASGFGKGFAFFLMGFGLFNLLSGALIAGIWLIFIGFFVMEAADASYRQLVMKRFISGTKIGDYITKDVIVIPAEMRIGRMIDEYFLRYRHHSFPVVRDDQILGILTLHDIKLVPRDNWLETTARDIMKPLRQDMVIGPQADAMEALAKLAANQVGRLLVIERDKLLGIISHKDIMRLFEIRSEIEG
ncbi:MAG: site-2 protease family protein [Candidatus Saganbacteria bacterium]|nr:site-2 protease family protein [Candidatus Saganbacteria bacterium]